MTAVLAGCLACFLQGWRVGIYALPGWLALAIVVISRGTWRDGLLTVAAAYAALTLIFLAVVLFFGGMILAAYGLAVLLYG